MLKTNYQRTLDFIQKNWVLAIVYFPIFWTLAFSFTVSNGRSIASKLFVISAIFFLFHFKKEVLSFLKKPKPIKILLACLFVLITFRSSMFLYHGEHTSSIRAFSIIFLYIYAFPYWLVKEKHIKLIVFSSSMLLGLDALIHIINNGFLRYGGNTNPNPYGLYAALLFIVTYILMIRKNNNKLLFIIPFTMLTILPLFTSQSRGVWVSILVVLIIYHMKNIKLSLKNIIIIFLIGGIGALSLYQIPIIKNRIASTINEINKIEHNNLNSSMGIRLQIWSDSTLLIKQHPLLGVGHNYKSINTERLEKNEISQLSYHFSNNHQHNQFLEFIVKQGLIGLLIILGCILLPIALLIKEAKNTIIRDISLSLSLVLLMNFITEVPFNWINFTYGYLIIILCLFFINYKNELSLGKVE